MSCLSYEMWTDADGKLHDISTMDKSYINSCLNQLYLWAKIWKNVKLTDLSDTEKKQSDEVGSKAWSVEHCKGFIKAFEKELAKREKT